MLYLTLLYLILCIFISYGILSIIKYKNSKKNLEKITKEKLTNLTLPDIKKSKLTKFESNILNSLENSNNLLDINTKNAFSIANKLREKKKLPLYFNTDNTTELYLSYEATTQLDKYSPFRQLCTTTYTTKSLIKKQLNTAISYFQSGLIYAYTAKKDTKINITATDLVYTLPIEKLETDLDIINVGYTLGCAYADYEESILVALLKSGNISMTYNVSDFICLYSRCKQDYKYIILIPKEYEQELLAIKKELNICSSNITIHVMDSNLFAKLYCDMVIIEYKDFLEFGIYQNTYLECAAVKESDDIKDPLYIQTLLRSSYYISGYFSCDFYKLPDDNTKNKQINITIH